MTLGRRGVAALLLPLLALAHAGAAGAAEAAHVMHVVIDPAKRTLAGENRIEVRSPRPFVLALDARYTVDALMVDGKPVAPPGARGGVQRWPIGGASTPREVVVRWRGSLDPVDTQLDHRATLGNARPVTGGEGTFLPAASRWYPAVEGAIERYTLTLELPAGQKGLVAGRLVEESDQPDGYRARFAFDAPSEGIDLMAGPYRVESRTVKSLSGRPLLLRTYFHPQLADLSAGYLDDVARYLDLYERWIGPYPFDGFSVVSSPTPTGFGMPSLTYLGIDVLRLPFIRQTSLGHEVLHNWWGNGVYPDYARGNWSEGLTTFMADYAYKERESAEAAREMRLGWLRNLSSVPPGQDKPLAAFTSRTHGTSQIVGYDKAAMMFLMLRDAIGTEAFDAGVRRFYAEHRCRTASWADLRKSLEAASGRNLEPFFRQWLDRPGIPSVQLEAAAREPEGEGRHVKVTLVQRGEAPPYRLRVPIVLRTDAGDEHHHVELDRGRGEFVLEGKARPRAVVLDPDLRLMRRLGSDEAPPVLRRAMVDPQTRTVVLASGAAAEAARELAAKLLDHEPRALDPAADLPPGPVLAIGTSDEVQAWLARHRLPPRPAAVVDSGTGAMWTTPRQGAGPLTVVVARDAASLAALVRPLPHYGRQSYVVFAGAKATDRGVWPLRPQEVRVE
jgi:hypothetical protein